MNKQEFKQLVKETIMEMRLKENKIAYSEIPDDAIEIMNDANVEEDMLKYIEVFKNKKVSEKETGTEYKLVLKNPSLITKLNIRPFIKTGAASFIDNYITFITK